MGVGLILQDLVTGYAAEEELLIKPLSLNARPGEIWMLGGRNGTGKSTLLSTIARLTPPIHGKIFWNDVDIETLDPPSCSKIFAIVLTLKPEAASFTALEVVETGLLRRLLRSGAKRTAAFEYLQHAGAAHLAHRRFDRLSDGEKQRVMMARALAQETPVLLLDEPSAYLDFAARAELSVLLSRWAADLNKLIFVSSHDHHALLPVCTHLLFLENGCARLLEGIAVKTDAYKLFTLPDNAG